MKIQPDKVSELDEDTIRLLLVKLTHEIEALNNKVNFLLQLQGVPSSTLKDLERDKG